MSNLNHLKWAHIKHKLPVTGSTHDTMVVVLNVKGGLLVRFGGDAVCGRECIWSSSGVVLGQCGPVYGRGGA